MIQVLSVEENERFITTVYTIDGVHPSHTVTEIKPSEGEQVNGNQ